jgi:hypothetical protein
MLTISYSDPSKNVADPPSIAELLEVLEPMRIERERKQAIRDGLAPVSLSHSLRIPLIASPAVVETASTVANQDTSQQTALKRRSPEEVVVEERATNVETRVISPETARPSPVEEVGIVSIVVSLDICLRTVRRKGSPGGVVAEGHVMGVERRVISREIVLRRPVEEVVVVVSTMGKMVIS